MASILSYDYGNQAGRSRFEVSSTGIIKHVNVITAGQTEVKEKKLTAAQLKALKERIEAASRAVEPRDFAHPLGNVTAMGSSSGDFFVTNKAGKKATIVNITRSDFPNGTNRDTVTVNKLAEAKAIYDFVVGKTKVDIPNS